MNPPTLAAGMIVETISRNAISRNVWLLLEKVDKTRGEDNYFLAYLIHGKFRNHNAHFGFVDFNENSPRIIAYCPLPAAK